MFFDIFTHFANKNTLQLENKPDESPEWYLLAAYMTREIAEHKYTVNSTTNLLSYHFVFRRNWSYVRFAFVVPTIGICQFYGVLFF